MISFHRTKEITEKLNILRHLSKAEALQKTKKWMHAVKEEIDALTKTIL